jgi:hypothetical protein
MICKNCRSYRMRRIKREGLLRKYLAPLFGFYPWRCSDCRTVQLLRSRGKRRSKHQEDSSHQDSASEKKDSF